jgi:endoribonuclease Dicer
MNLFNNPIKKELYRYIRSRAFSRYASLLTGIWQQPFIVVRDRHTWYRRVFPCWKAKDSKKLRSLAEHSLAGKTIADVCEALLGASLLSGGTEHRFDMAVKAVTILVDNEDHKAWF